MTEKNKTKICSQANKAKIKLDNLRAHLARCEEAADFGSPESVIISNIQDSISEAYSDLGILISRTKPKVINSI